MARPKRSSLDNADNASDGIVLIFRKTQLASQKHSLKGTLFFRYRFRQIGNHISQFAAYYCLRRGADSELTTYISTGFILYTQQTSHKHIFQRLGNYHHVAHSRRPCPPAGLLRPNESRCRRSSQETGRRSLNRIRRQYRKHDQQLQPARPNLRSVQWLLGNQSPRPLDAVHILRQRHTG